MKPDFLELFKALDRGGVDHVVVGGVAAILEGAPITTLDLDLVCRLDDDNLRRLATLLEELDARYRDPAGREIRPTVERLRSNLAQERQITTLVSGRETTRVSSPQPNPPTHPAVKQ